MELPRILFVDDEQCMRSSCELVLSKAFGENKAFEMEFFSSPDQALVAIKRNPFNVAMVVLDHHFRDLVTDELVLGSDYIKKIKSLNSYIEVIMMSGDQSSESLRLWLKNGADKFLYKDSEGLQEKIQVFITQALTKFHSKFGQAFQRHSNGMSRVPDSLKKLGLVSVSDEMKGVADLVLQCANSDLSVFIIGETGTGKELVARAIHQNSDRLSNEFRVIDCTQFKQSQIIASELFGSEKGAFTGAESKVGLFEVANGGTVFLDEVHHLDEVAQGMLLRFLQDKIVRRVGGKTEKKVNVRLIFAGKPILKDLVQKGSFLPDLFYRMKEVKIDLPRLGDRTEDIEILAFYFLEKIASTAGKSKTFHPDTIKLLQSYKWPGNVRELENLIKRLSVMVPDTIISPADVKKFGELDLEQLDEEYLEIMTFDELQAKHNREKRDLILRAYEISDFNMAETARLLGVARTTLRNQCRDLGIRELMEVEPLKEMGKNSSEVRRFFRQQWKSITSAG